MTRISAVWLQVIFLTFFGNGISGHAICAQGEDGMTTRDTIEKYFALLEQNREWQAILSEDMIFISYTNPPRQVTGKDAYLAATKRFYSMIQSLKVRALLVDQDRACALTHYELQPAGGVQFVSDVAEIFHVRNGKISSFEIYFDSAPFPK